MAWPDWDERTVSRPQANIGDAPVESPKGSVGDAQGPLACDRRQAAGDRPLSAPSRLSSSAPGIAEPPARRRTCYTRTPTWSAWPGMVWSMGMSYVSSLIQLHSSVPSIGHAPSHQRSLHMLSFLRLHLAGSYTPSIVWLNCRLPRKAFASSEQAPFHSLPSTT